MVAFGITGGAGMGKGVVSAWLERQGERVVDSDVLARELVAPGEPALEEIAGVFGGGVLDGGGNLNRAALAKLVFADGARRRTLEEILHPRIRERWRARLTEWRGAGATRAFAVIPLLYETGAEGELDQVICVACSGPAQAKRLRERGWTNEEARRRVQSQWPVERKMDRADFVIWNESTVAVCEEQARRVLE